MARAQPTPPLPGGASNGRRSGPAGERAFEDPHGEARVVGALDQGGLGPVARARGFDPATGGGRVLQSLGHAPILARETRLGEVEVAAMHGDDGAEERVAREQALGRREAAPRLVTRPIAASTAPRTPSKTPSTRRSPTDRELTVALSRKRSASPSKPSSNASTPR